MLANLATTFAESGKRVTAVDCDLRRPGLHRLFGVAEAPGLTTMILDPNAELPLQATSVPNLEVLASGPLPPNPAEILASEPMVGLISQLSDAAALAARVDGVLLVVDAGRTRRETARQAKEQLARVGARLLGVVLNNVSRGRGLYDYDNSR